MEPWFQIRRNVIQLLEFLMDCELILTVEDVIDLGTKPEKYDEVWKLYQKEIEGVY
jgi:hypothetical protein